MYWLSKKRYMILMLVPTIAVYFVYMIAPIAVAVGYSFTKYTGIGKAKFVGLKNYIRLFQDTTFLLAFKNTILMFIIIFILLMAGGFAIALLLNKKMKYSGTAKALIFSPAIIAPIIVGIIWVFILDPEVGLINAFLKEIGLGKYKQLWIGGDTLTPYCVAFIYFWQQLGYIATIFIAGLKMIPEEVLEAAQVDGTSEWQKVCHVIIPMMRSTVSTVAILIITGTFKIFEVVQQLTNGGPNHQSEMLVTYSYASTFANGEYGYGMSMATITFIVSLIIMAIYSFVTKEREGRRRHNETKKNF